MRRFADRPDRADVGFTLCRQEAFEPGCCRGESYVHLVRQLIASILEKLVNHGELAPPEAFPSPAEAREQRIYVLDEGRKNALFDLGVLSGMNCAVTQLDYSVQVVPGRLQWHEEISATKSLRQADCTDLREALGAVDAEEPHQRRDARIVPQVG